MVSVVGGGSLCLARACVWGLLLTIGLGGAAAWAVPTNLVQNGSFDDGTSTHWDVHYVSRPGDYGTMNSKQCLPDQTGNNFFYLNTYWGGDICADQAGIVLPSDAPATLSFRVWGHLDPVTVKVIIIDTQGPHTLDTFTPPITEWSENPNDTSKPIQCTGNTDITKTYSLAAFEGQTITLRFESTSNGTNGTFADFDDIAITAEEPTLAASLAAKPAEVELDDPFKVALTVTNNGKDTVTNVAPGTLTSSGQGDASLVSGPEPASVVSLAAGASASFVYAYEATKEGKLQFECTAHAKDGSGNTVDSNTAKTGDITIGPYITLVRATSAGVHDRLVAGGKATIHAEFMKVGKTEVTVSLDPGVTLYKGLQPATIAADKTGTVAVDLPVRIGDETDDEIYTNVMDADQGPGELSLDSRLVLKLDYKVEDAPKSRKVTDSLYKADNSVWSITYPDYSVVTGEPPAGSAKELKYYQQGNVVNWEHKPSLPVYLKDALTRKWMLKAARYTSVDDTTPDEPRDAAANLAQFLVDKLPFKWTGTGNELETWARQLEAGTPHTVTACVNFSFYLGAATRVVGLRSREMNNALKYIAGWAQHATNQIWFDGKWNWFDSALAKSFNDGKPIRDYPLFYFTKAKYAYVLPYGQIKTWYAIDDHGYNFVLGNDNGQSSELKEPEKWQLYEYHSKKDMAASGGPQDGALKESSVIITMHSPVTALYTDDQGRRLGVVGPLVAADYLGIESVPPLTGGGSVWEVLCGVYIAPGTYTQYGVDPSCADVQVDEQIIIPIGSLGQQFTLALTGTGDGPYGVTISHVTESGSTELYASQGTIEQGKTVQLDLQADTSESVPIIQAESSKPVNTGPCFLGGAAGFAMLVGPLLVLGWLGRRTVR